MEKETKNLLDSVDYDLTTARYMLDSGRYVYVIFMCHLSVEKMLKAVVIEETRKAHPKTHDLIYLMELAKIKLSQGQLDFIGIINNAGVVTRYPEDLSALIASYPKEISGNYLSRSEEIVQCIKSDPRLR